MLEHVEDLLGGPLPRRERRADDEHDERHHGRDDADGDGRVGDGADEEAERLGGGALQQGGEDELAHVGSGEADHAAHDPGVDHGEGQLRRAFGDELAEAVDPRGVAVRQLLLFEEDVLLHWEDGGAGLDGDEGRGHEDHKEAQDLLEVVRRQGHVPEDHAEENRQHHRLRDTHQQRQRVAQEGTEVSRNDQGRDRGEAGGANHKRCLRRRGILVVGGLVCVGYHDSGRRVRGRIAGADIGGGRGGGFELMVGFGHGRGAVFGGAGVFERAVGVQHDEVVEVGEQVTAGLLQRLHHGAVVPPRDDLHGGHDLLGSIGVEPRRRLVEDEDRRPRDEGHGDARAPALTAGDASKADTGGDHVVGALLQPEFREQRRGDALGLGLGRAVRELVPEHDGLAGRVEAEHDVVRGNVGDVWAQHVQGILDRLRRRLSERLVQCHGR